MNEKLTDYRKAAIKHRTVVQDSEQKNCPSLMKQS